VPVRFLRSRYIQGVPVAPPRFEATDKTTFVGNQSADGYSNSACVIIRIASPEGPKLLSSKVWLSRDSHLDKVPGL
jgi:hypothetical protein